MAYSLGDRFAPVPKCYKLLDPGAYVSTCKKKTKQNNAPFLSNTLRKTAPGAKLWTHAIYNEYKPDSIPNCTSLQSRTPRFPYHTFTEEDLEDLLCRCGIEKPCECPVEEKEDEICQGKVSRRLFTGPPPHSTFGGGISAPSKTHRGFEILPDGSTKQLINEIKADCPPFYDARVNEFTSFYHGCKWSKWKSQRTLKSAEVRPGPADYSFEKKLTDYEKCIEELRASRRKTSKQPRFIELVQRRNILENRPGPASYSPQNPKGTNMKSLGPRAERFPESQYEQRPGPAEYSVKRDFDLPDPPEYPCHAKLPEPPFFGVKALRFKPVKPTGPGPATYNPKSKICNFVHCQVAPFDSSAVRFKDQCAMQDDIESMYDETEDNIEEKIECPALTCGFKSKTVRDCRKPLVKKMNEASPADLLIQFKTKVSKSPFLQYIAPFDSSEGRFQPWYDWMAVFGNSKTPGPCYYCLEKPKCNPAVLSGPLFRTRRFHNVRYPTPSPNEYKVGRGLETILATHNKRLKKNIENQHKFCWKPIVEPRKLTFQEKETLLFKKSIALLETGDGAKTSVTSMNTVAEEGDKNKNKMLRCFLYQRPIPQYF